MLKILPPIYTSALPSFLTPNQRKRKCVDDTILPPKIPISLRRLKRSDNKLKLPEHFKIGQASADGNCFFDSFRQGLEQQLSIKVTVEQLRQNCKEFAENDPPDWFKESIANSHDNNGGVRSETPDEYIKHILNKSRWGDPDVEGRILCQKYGVKLHVIEKLSYRLHLQQQILNEPEKFNEAIKLAVMDTDSDQALAVKLQTIGSHEALELIESITAFDGVDTLHQLMSPSGLLPLAIDYYDGNTLHIINEGNHNFEPVLDTTQTGSIPHQRQQSPSDNPQELKSSRRRSSDSSDYEDKPISREEELINTVRSNDSQEEKVTKLARLLAQGADINFKDATRNNDTPLHIAVRKKELKVIEFLVKQGADITLKNNRGRTPLDIANRFDRPAIVHLLEADFHLKPQQSKESVIEQFARKSDKPERTQPGDKNTNVASQRKQGDPVHGNIYQLKLLMLFLYRGVSQQYSFRLGTEIKEAKKFDDLLFEYIGKDGKKEYRLLQAKHRLDEAKKITAGELLTESDGDYSLIKYFFSYQDVKKEKLFKDGVIKDVIICTNVDLDFDELQSKQIHVEKLTERTAYNIAKSR